MVDDGDISHTITAKSDQLNACDLIAGPITVTVQSVKTNGPQDQPVWIDIGGGYQPYKPCLTVRRILAKLWGTKSRDWVGRSMTLFCDETVRWAGEDVGGIRVSHVSGIQQTAFVTTRASKRSVTKAKIEPIANQKKEHYSQESFEENLPKWVSMINSGVTTVDGILSSAHKNGFVLTPEQVQRINRELKK
jgi:hypothetical protein